MQCVILWLVNAPESVTSVLAWHAKILGLNEEIHCDDAPGATLQAAPVYPLLQVQAPLPAIPLAQVPCPLHVPPPGQSLHARLVPLVPLP